MDEANNEVLAFVALLRAHWTDVWAQFGSRRWKSEGRIYSWCSSAQTLGLIGLQADRSTPFDLPTALHTFLSIHREELIALCKQKVSQRPRRGATHAQLANGVPLLWTS